MMGHLLALHDKKNDDNHLHRFVFLVRNFLGTDCWFHRRFWVCFQENKICCL